MKYEGNIFASIFTKTEKLKQGNFFLIKYSSTLRN